MRIDKSPFEDICKEDFNQFRELASRFQKVDMVDIVELQHLTIDAWLLATRWSEIQSNAVKIAIEYNVNKTDFSNWAYQKYRQLQELHITARCWHRMANEDYEANKKMEG